MSPLFPNIQSTLDLNGPELSFTTQPQSTSIASAATYSGETSPLIQETYNGYPVRGFLYYPTSSGVSSNLDVVVLYHPTIEDAGKTPIDAALNFLKIAQDEVDLKDKLIFSVAYPQDSIPGYTQEKATQQFPGLNIETLYLGDNIVYAEAALLWVQNRLSYYLASNNIPKTVNKVYTFGHSQGAYLTHRLNTLQSARYEIAFDMIGDGGRQATAVRSFSLTISGKDISDETVNVTDTKGTVTTTNVGQGLTLSVTRYINPNLSGSSGNPIGSIKYFVDISGTSRPSLQVSVLDPTLRGSGLIDSNGSIALSPGYPNLISSNIIPPAETINITDTQGTISTSFSTTNSSGIGVSVTRVIDDNLLTATSPNGNPIGTVTYEVEITGASNPHLRTTILDTSTRGSGSTDPNGSIAASSGYPIKLSANKFILSFDMISTVDSSQRQSTAVRSFSLTITSDGGAPIGGVVSNAPGPIDLLTRCSAAGINSTCDKIDAGIGSTTSNPDAYNSRSLKNFLSGTLFPSLFTQATDDPTGDAFGVPQVLNMQNIVQVGLSTCTNCATHTFKYYSSGGTGNTGGGHAAFANNPLVQKDIRDFVGSVGGGGVASFTGIATATFPAGQTERETNTGTVTHQWYSGTTALNDGSIGNVTITGSATTTLTLSGLTNPLPISGQVFLRAGYDPSAYFVAGIGKSTPNASNEPLDSNTATLTILPTISIDTQPQNTTVVEDTATEISIVASVSDGSDSDLRYQWYLNGSAISGATSATLSITRPNPGFDKVYCEVSHPTAQPGTIRSNVVKLDVATSRTFIKWEKIGGGTVQESGERNLATFGAFSARARTNVNARIVQMWSPEKDIEVKVTLGACAGESRNGNRGGEGGISVFKMTMKQNTEYTVKLGVTDSLGGGPRGGNNGGGGLAVIYEKAKVLAVCGGGGGAGTGGRGGDGGGCNVAGSGGQGQGSSIGGRHIEVDQLPVIGSTQAGRSGFNDFDNDSSSARGRLGGCTVGSDYWRNNGYAPCDDIPSTEPFRSVDGSIMSNTTGITRGYKTGQGWRNNGGAGTGNGGGGGAGATGGQGNFRTGGGGGASGYIVSGGLGGEVELLSSSALPNGTKVGGNDDVAFISVEAYNPGLDGQQEPFIPPKSTASNDLRETTFNITRDSQTDNVIVYEKQSGIGPDTLTFGPNGGSFTAQIVAGAVYTLKSQPAGSKLRIDTHMNTLEVEDSTDDDYNDLKVNPNIGFFDASTLSYTN